MVANPLEEVCLVACAITRLGIFKSVSDMRVDRSVESAHHLEEKCVLVAGFSAGVGREGMRELFVVSFQSAVFLVNCSPNWSTFVSGVNFFVLFQVDNNEIAVVESGTITVVDAPLLIILGAVILLLLLLIREGAKVKVVFGTTKCS